MEKLNLIDKLELCLLYCKLQYNFYYNTISRICSRTWETSLKGYRTEWIKEKEIYL